MVFLSGKNRWVRSRREGLIARFARFDKKNGKGTSKQRDWFYGFHADMWAAYAVGVTCLDRMGREEGH